MKNVTPLKKVEKVELNGGFSLTGKIGPLTIEDWNPDIGWEDEGPNGDKYFPG